MSRGSDTPRAIVYVDGFNLAFRARNDLAVVISNDSDLKEPIHFVRHESSLVKGRSGAVADRAIAPKRLYRNRLALTVNLALRESAYRDEATRSSPHRSVASCSLSLVGAARARVAGR